MSGRSFADRYRDLTRASGGEIVRPPVDDGWPVPSGGTLHDLDEGPIVGFERTYDGPAYDEARALIAAVSSLQPEDCVFLDTETTGLAGGTGTYAFLVGLGRFVPGGFRVVQYFMRHPGEEPALLAAVHQELEGARRIVSFNGRAFDMPLLETRYRIHLRPFSPPTDHLDLLPKARAIWKHRLPSCSLGTLEQHILRETRTVDAPGWLIPSIYFAYLRERSTRDLVPVIEHNRADIGSLARLTAIVSGHLTGHLEPQHPTDRLAAALARLRASGTADSMRSLLVALEDADAPADLRLRALRECSVALKRAARHEDLVPAWRRALGDRSRAIRLFAAEELSKYLEHHQHDYRAALELSQRAADAARLAGDRQMVAAFEHRTRRLERKVREL